MNRFLGMFFSKSPRALQGLRDDPYVLMGRHALCAREYASDGGAMATASGRLRNARQLARKLADSGVHMTGNTASALVLASYRLWGEEYPRHLEGAVATVVIDQDARKLVLSRDALGELPVFYALQGTSVSFADHPTPLLEAPGVSRSVDRAGWCEVFGLGPARTPGRTPFQHVRALEPGEAMVAGDSGQRLYRHFELEARPHEQSEEETIETVRQLVEQAMEDVYALHPASMLSGGLDSSVLTALLARHLSGPVDTFSVDYEANGEHFTGGSYQPDQDAPWAEKAVGFLNTHHTRVVLPIDGLFEALGAAVEARGLPAMADIDSSLLLFAREIAHTHNAVVSGECGDEVFGGYPWFRREELIWQDSFPWSGSLMLRESILKPAVRQKLNLSSYVSARYHASIAALPTLPGETARDARLRQLQGLCFEYFMANLQERAQRMCEAHGVEVLTPYSDDRLVQYLYNVPWELKALRGHEKGLLRSAMEGLLPEELLWRKKSPYPKTYHPEYARLVCAALASVLRDPSAPILQLVDAEALLKLMAGPMPPTQAPWYGQLMAGPQMMAYLLQVNQWMLRQRVEVALD